MTINPNDKKWIVIVVVLALALLVNTVLIVQIYQRQEVLHATSRQELEALNHQRDQDFSVLNDDFLDTITELKTQLTEQEQLLTDATSRLDWLTEENELLKKKLQ